MIETLKYTNLYNSLNLYKNNHHAYLFSSVDKELNNNIALLFAKSLICENKNACNSCNACAQFNRNSHPDFILINQSSVKVEDANNIINKLNTKPISNNTKVFVILNAETINEIAQNKLLKSFEEPNSSNVFILTTNKTDKLLPTIISRLYKISVPKLTENDINIIRKELIKNNINLDSHSYTNFSLTEILNFETNEDYQKTLSAIKYVFENLKSSQDIPKVVSSLPPLDKTLFFNLLQKLFLSCINNTTFLDNNLKTYISNNYPTLALIKSLELTEEAYKKHMSNVNFTYILDNLLFNILKEKFLCKQ